MLGVLSVSTPLRSALFGNMLTRLETEGLFQGPDPTGDNGNDRGGNSDKNLVIYMSYTDIRIRSYTCLVGIY